MSWQNAKSLVLVSQKCQIAIKVYNCFFLNLGSRTVQMESKQLVGQTEPRAHLSYLSTLTFQANNLSLDHNDLIQHGHMTGTWQMRPSCEMFVLWTQITFSLKGCDAWSRSSRVPIRWRSCHIMTRRWKSRERYRVLRKFELWIPATQEG